MAIWEKGYKCRLTQYTNTEGRCTPNLRRRAEAELVCALTFTPEAYPRGDLLPFEMISWWKSVPKTIQLGKFVLCTAIRLGCALRCRRCHRSDALYAWALVWNGLNMAQKIVAFHSWIWLERTHTNKGLKKLQNGDSLTSPEPCPAGS